MYVVGYAGDDVVNTVYLLHLIFYSRLCWSCRKILCECLGNSQTGMTFNNDGTKMFIIGQSFDHVR